MKALIDGENAKICRECGILKSVSEYHKNKECSLGVVGTCTACTNERISGWYKRNRKRRQETANTKNQERKRFWVEKKGGKCQDCGGIFPLCCYDFHHEGDKKFNPSKAISHSYEKAEEELSKCVLLCSNCHRIRHFEGGNP